MPETKMEEHQELLAIARKRFTMAESAMSESRYSELDDLKFLAGSPDNQWQWPSDVLNSRGTQAGQSLSARPCLTINKLPQHVRQITNDQKENRPSGKVIPVNDKADSDLAEILTGIVRHIEYISDADVAYDTACEGQVTTGEGYFRLLTEYVDGESFDQEIKIGRIRNQFSVHIDPTIQDPCGADASWCFISEDMLKEEFETAYPDATPISSLQAQGVGDEQQWLNEDTVRIAEYFYIDTELVELHLYPGNQVVEADSYIAQSFRERDIKPIKIRMVEQKTVKWCKINGYEVLEEEVWPGDCIPIIRVVGNEYVIEGKLYVSGIIRNAKDPQRMYNYWASQEAEMLALAPKAPFVGYGGQFEGYEHQWKTANTTPWPYLEVNPDVVDGQGATLPLPQRSLPPMQQSGLIAAKMAAADDIKSTTGQYDASIGQRSNERSGKAILARERQADTGTYHYVDNLARAVRCSTRQIIKLIPKIYDTKRIARIMGMDGTPDQVKVDPEQLQAKMDIMDDSGAVIESVYNPGIGMYDVAVTTGPGYTTKRQEAADAMGQLLQGNPELWAIAGDLFVKGLDWPGSDDMAERLKRSIDPKLLEDKQKAQPPEMAQAQQQVQELQQQVQEMGSMLEEAKNEQEMERQGLEIKMYEAETKRMASVQEDMRPEQIQDIITGTLHAMMDQGELPGKKGMMMGDKAGMPDKMRMMMQKMKKSGMMDKAPSGMMSNSPEVMKNTPPEQSEHNQAAPMPEQSMPEQSMPTEGMKNV